MWWWFGCAPPDQGLEFPHSAGIVALPDLDPDPDRFEGELVAAEAELSFGDQPATVLAFEGTVPGPLITVDQGDVVDVRFRNELPDGYDNSIHWHGIEGYNGADGTPVTQEMVPPGDGFTYAFVASRPGLYWYHPHHRGAQSVFSGLYGPLLVREPAEAQLVDRGILPRREEVLVLSDLSVYAGRVLSAESDNPMEVMNGTEGDLLLVNGQVEPTFRVEAGAGVRLRVVNTSITRFWRLSVPGHTLYRVGGEGGLIDAVRVEGGTAPGELLDPVTLEPVGATEVDLGYPRGDVVLGPAERADLVLTTDGAVGEVLALRWEDVARGRHTMAMDGDVMIALDAPDDGTRPGRDVARFELVAPDGDAPEFVIAEGDPLLLAVGARREALPVEADVQWSGEGRVSLDERMDMWPDDAGVWQMSTWLGMDGEAWHPEHVGGRAQPLAPTARTAALGQVARIEVLSNSRMAHPYHLHGFSFEPRSITWWPNPEDEDYDPDAPPVRYTFDHVEFEDTIVIPGYASLEFAVRFDDPAGDGSAAGRWMEHCHILQHGENGMASEVVITQ